MTRHRSTRHRPARAFALVEMVFVVALIGFFTLLAAELFTATIAVPRKTGSAENTMLQLDSVLRRMRTDAWGAAAIEFDGDRAATLKRPDGTRILWRADDDGAISRQVEPAPATATAPAHWTVRGLRLAFAPADCGLAVHAHMPARHAREEFLLVSQVQLLRREARR